jgi:hypothetical protein
MNNQVKTLSKSFNNEKDILKDMGKVAIHVGGSVQLLFGIKGKRWDDRTDIITEEWDYPLPQDCPQGKEVVENACYW